jgi:hypothetical protein
VKTIEGQGSQSGKTQNDVVVADCGQLNWIVLRDNKIYNVLQIEESNKNTTTNFLYLLSKQKLSSNPINYSPLFTPHSSQLLVVSENLLFHNFV